MTHDTKSVASAPTNIDVTNRKRSFKSTKDRIAAQKSNEKVAQSPIDEIADSMLEAGLYQGSDGIEMTRQESPLPANLAKIAEENKVVALNLKKRKSLLMVESRRPHVGDAMADRMVAKVEEQYKRELSNLDLLEDSPIRTQGTNSPTKR